MGFHFYASRGAAGFFECWMSVNRGDKGSITPDPGSEGCRTARLLYVTATRLSFALSVVISHRMGKRYNLEGYLYPVRDTYMPVRVGF